MGTDHAKAADQPPGRAHRMADIVRARQVSINCNGAVDVNTPFGGYKQSEWGREYGSRALDLYTETKTITARP
jgi:phenylacetaldehyde dehydrogenase